MFLPQCNTEVICDIILETLILDFKKPDDEEYIMQLESELEKLKAEKELGWVDGETSTKNNLEKEILNQEIARLNEKVKKQNIKVEDFKKKEAEWNEREAKYQATCKNFKKTISDMKKDADNAKKTVTDTKSFEKLFSEHSGLKKSQQEEIAVLYALCQELQMENVLLREDRSKARSISVNLLESSMKMFEFEDIDLRV